MKIINDTLKNDAGKFSAKRFTALASFVMACSLPMYAIYKGTLDGTIVSLSIEFLAACLVCLGISSWQKTRIVEAQESTKQVKEELPPDA